MLTFLIPVCHPKNAKNWTILKKYLTETFQSISAQDSDDWQVVLVANRGSDLPLLPDKFNVCYVDYPPNTKYNRETYDNDTVKEAFRLDKGRRMLSGALRFKDSTDYFMFLDCDDFVHKGIASFVKENLGVNGWYIKYGYIWNDGGNFLMKYKDYSQLCGSSLIIRTDLLQLPQSIEEANDEYIKLMLGSHVLNQKVFQERNTPLLPLPFAGGVYRVANSQAHSVSNSIFRHYIFNAKNLLKPHRFLINIFNIRKLNSTLRKTFFGV